MDNYRILLSQETIEKRVKELGAEITRDYKDKKPVVICMLKGAVYFFADLTKNIKLPLMLDFARLSSYRNGTTSGQMELIYDITAKIEGRDVIIVEDIVDSGMTLSYIKSELQHRGASSVRIATLLDKPARRRVDLKVEYSCFEIPDAFVVGYGLDYDEKYRNLPDVGILAPRIYTKE